MPYINLPWSETNPIPLLLGTLYRVTFPLAFHYRSNLPVHYTMVAASLIIFGFKMYIRTVKSIMFDKITYFTMMLGDTIIFHFLVLMIPAIFF